jgi:hypothetical protein
MSSRKIPQINCLVLYPKENEQYYLKVYSPAIQKANGKPLNLAKVLTTSSRIRKVRDIIDQVQMVIADVSGRDKDVLFRAGLAQALGKPVAIIARNAGDIPSDLQHVGYATYDTRRPEWVVDLRQDIIDLVGEALNAKKE